MRSTRRYWDNFKSWLDARGWGRRARNDALVIIALGLASYAAAEYYEAFDRLYAFGQANADYGVDDALIVLLIVGAAMFIYCVRRMNDLAREITARREAEIQHEIETNRSQLAVDNMIQGLCMFDAQNRLLVWNERYRAMYNIDPKQIWRGCAGRDLLDARVAAGMFPLDPVAYGRELHAALAKGRGFTLNIDLADGRTIAVVNQPIEGGGWVATHEDITERTRSVRELDRTRTFLDTIINNVPSTIVVKEVPSFRYLLVNDVGEKYFGLPREKMIGKTAAEIFPKGTADFIQRNDLELLTSCREIFDDEHPIVGPDGRSHIITATRLPVIGPDGKPQYIISVIHDVTERKRDERELEHTRAFLDMIIENVPSPIIVKSIPGLRYVLINRAAEKYLGVDRSGMLGKTTADKLPKISADMIEAEDRKLIASGQSVFRDEHAIATPANGMRIVTSTRMSVAGPDGKPQYLITVLNDITDRKRNEQRIAHMAHHDPLTDLPNRTAFNECIAATLELAQASGESFALLSIDLDRFKTINDVYGHAVGDRLLGEIAGRLESACRGAFIARVGGDEFHVITPTGPQPATAEALANKLCAALDTDIDIDGIPLRAGLTGGVAIFPQDGADAVTLAVNADAALFRAKSEARGSIRFFELAMDQQLREKRTLQQDLRSAIVREEIELHYQPQAQIGGEITGFEALVRWHHPDRGLVSPATFIPLAEESGLIVELGEWILRTACREAASWPRPLGIAINLSPVQFQHGDLPKLVHQILLETGLSPARLELEITEGVLIGDFNRAVSILRRLKALGLRIAMDDFGTGYSSLSYLQSFPFDKIKIDQSFIANLGRSQQAATIVRVVIALGRGLALPVLAEGVETEEQLKFLAGESCNEVQGYFIGRPKPIADYAALVGRGPTPRPKLAIAG
ncbi:MAG TPA: EAL domain-containing protein [Pseudolabrys sp.]